jgi:hypothetical protein
VLLESGLLLVLIPWSAFWDRNYFVEGSAIAALFTSNYTRGAVSGLGLVNVWSALAELAELFGSRRTEDPESNQPSEM